ncbi:MAG: hypothetical protein IPM27_11590 [Nitrosomonadales bacterium]|nr:hypothetical protein [Nitrosomonadales bacterium]
MSHKSRPGVLLAVNKKNYTNTLELVRQVDRYLAQQGTRIASSGVQLTLNSTTQTVPTRQAISPDGAQRPARP